MCKTLTIQVKKNIDRLIQKRTEESTILVAIYFSKPKAFGMV